MDIDLDLDMDIDLDLDVDFAKPIIAEKARSEVCNG